MLSKLKIVIVGGGSCAWTPKIVKDMFLTESIGDSEFVLLDINKKASDTNKAFLDKLAAQLGINPTIVSTNNRRKALEGADYIIITISTGGLKAMRHDLAIPKEYRIYHTVGDTCGPGGWARFIRNFDVFQSLAQDINRYACGAFVLNYTNPMTTLTDVLTRICEGPVIGLCHGLFQNLWFLRLLYDAEDEHEISLKYGGLNHFFWITEAKVRKRDVLGDLKNRIKHRSLTDMLEDVNKDEFGYSSNSEIATELFRFTGTMPYLGDRHICEFFPCYITNKQNMRKYKLKSTTIIERKMQLQNRTKKIGNMIRGTIDKGFFTRSRETAADIIEAHSQGKTFTDVGNMPNTDQISNLPRGSIVETAVRVSRKGIFPARFGALPSAVQALCEPRARLYTMLVDACFNKDKQLAMQALRLDPLCSCLNGEEVTELGQRLLNAHKRFISVF